MLQCEILEWTVETMTGFSIVQRYLLSVDGTLFLRLLTRYALDDSGEN